MSLKEYIKGELKEFKKWEAEEGFIPSGEMKIKYSTRPVKNGGLVYEMIKKLNPVAQELLETKKFRDYFKAFRKKNQIDTFVSYKNIKNWQSGYSNEPEEETKISNFLNGIMKKHQLSDSWKDSLWTYLFIYVFPSPLFHTISLRKKSSPNAITISFTSKNVSKKDLYKFIDVQWKNIQHQKEKLTAEKNIGWKEKLRTMRFAFFLKEERGLQIKKIKQIIESDLLEMKGLKKYVLKRESLKTYLKTYKRRYWK